MAQTYHIDGRVWRVAQIMPGPIPWAWLVNVSRPMEQARYPASLLPLVRGPSTDRAPGLY